MLPQLKCSSVLRASFADEKKCLFTTLRFCLFVQLGCKSVPFFALGYCGDLLAPKEECLKDLRPLLTPYNCFSLTRGQPIFEARLQKRPQK